MKSIFKKLIASAIAMIMASGMAVSALAACNHGYGFSPSIRPPYRNVTSTHIVHIIMGDPGGDALIEDDVVCTITEHYGTLYQICMNCGYEYCAGERFLGRYHSVNHS